jgi:uncharacterized cofD-like protein
VVAVGGGYGLSTTLRAARRFAGRVTGVVSVADDGGSSGRLRKAFGIPAPGDLRRCLVALAEPGSVWADAFEHRFAASELQGHPLGNIILAGLTETLGSFGEAIDEALTLLGGVGRVFPATVDPVTLTATYRRSAGSAEQPIAIFGTVEGEVRVGSTLGLTSVAVSPADPDVPKGALASIRDADLICIGPGSLFTSVLAVLAVPRIGRAIGSARALKVYVANLGEQHPETSGFDVARHVEALRAHGVEVDVVVHDPAHLALGDVGEVLVVGAPLADASGRLHDPVLLADALQRLVELVGT